MSLVRVKVEVYALGSKKPVATFHLNETNLGGWAEVINLVNRMLFKGLVK